MKKHRCAECGNVQTQKSYCISCCGTSLLPLTGSDRGIKTHEQYMEARGRLDELKAISEPTSDDKTEKRSLAVHIWIYEQRISVKQ